MKTFNLTIILALCFAVFGCGGAEGPAANSTSNRAANTASTSNTSSTSSTANTADADKKDDAADKKDAAAVTGVAACDEYLAAMDKFIENPNVPQATKDAYKSGLEQSRNAWKQAASTPQGKAGLETGCKAAMDAAKSTLEQYK